MNPNSTALLLVHLENDIVTAEGAFGPAFSAHTRERDVLAKTAGFLARVRPLGVKVVYLRIAFDPSYADLTESIPLLAMTRQAGALQDGSHGAEINAAVAPVEGDTVVTHKVPGPFTGSGLEELLRGAGVTDVLVAGVATNASVEGTVRQASDLGFATVLVEDLTAASDDATHAASVASQGLFARISSADEILAELA